jgi:signal transduction histidine kinase
MTHEGLTHMSLVILARLLGARGSAMLVELVRRTGSGMEGAVGMSAQRVALTQLVGKTITGVVVTEGPGSPRSQVFLTFSDNTYYELYSVNGEIVGVSHLRDGGVDDVRTSTSDRRIAHEVVDTISTPLVCSPGDGADGEWYEERLERSPDLRGVLSAQAPVSILPSGLILSADDDRLAIGDEPLVGAALEPIDEPQSAPPEPLTLQRGFQPSLLAGRVIHDVANALGTIGGFSELLIASLPPLLPDRDSMREYLEWIGVATRDAMRMISRYRDLRYGRSPSHPFAQLRLDQLVGQAISLTRPRWQEEAQATGRTIRIETELEDLPPILGDATELREMLTNLLHNAIDAIADAGVITIRAERRGDDALLQVVDTGVGMREDVRRRSVEPFFTTKRDQGTGLGLAIVDEVVARHGGTMDIESTLGVGTTVSLCFALATPDVDTESSGRPTLSIRAL